MSTTSAERVTEGYVIPANKPTRGKGKPWSKEEDEVICIAWLDISQDPIISTNQKADKMYSRIFNRFLEICADKGIVGDYRTRTAQAIKSRWSNISKAVSKFAGCCSKVEGTYQSGSSPADNIKKALALYQTDTGSHFSLLHCYDILSIAPKWQQHSSLPKPAQSQLDEELLEPNPTNEDQMPSCSSARPVGQKRAKTDLTQSENLLTTLREIADNGKRLIELSEMKLEDSKNRTGSLKMMIHHKIMSVDYTKLSPTAQIYYNQQQKLILEESEREQLEKEQLLRFGDEQIENTSLTNLDGNSRDISVNRATSSRIVRIDTIDQLNQNVVVPETLEDFDVQYISYSPESVSETETTSNAL